ncbi:MAG: hypothetical protein JXA78_19905 [Anaerolineales bacterium]|nr:hypothetical protein [Anaerolineales bacterium]
MNLKRTLLVVMSAVLVLALGVGVVALVSISGVSAQESTPQPEEGGFPPQGERGFPPHGERAFPGRGGEKDNSYLAEALGISLEELQAAYQQAQEAAIEQALEQGLITQEQADAMKEDHRGFFGKGFRHGGPSDEGEAIDFEALLAEALGITVEDLQAAREQAASAAIQAAIESGELTQEQADLMAARKALMGYLDKDRMSEALGITPEELQAARQEGKSPKDLMEEKGLTTEDIQAAMRAAYEAAVQQALEDGAITQAQADLLLSDEAGFGHGGRGGFPGFGGRGRPGMGGPGDFERPSQAPDSAAPESDA